MNTQTPMTLNAGDLLNERQAAELIGARPQTLANWRHLGKGPKWRRIGQRFVRYHRQDLAAFVEGAE